MPFYTHVCDACGHTQDHLLKMGAAESHCPKCQSAEYRKVISAPGGFAFKGNGFYQTDYKTPCGMDKQEAQARGCSGSCGCG